jgi:glycosyltransferase involved in cell wall biosynthesis
MKILFDALGLPSYGGAKSSALGWIRSVADKDPEQQIIVVINEHESALQGLSNLEQIVMPALDKYRARIWAQVYIPRIVRNRDIDLVHFAKNHGSFFVPCPSIITINDLSRFHYPNMFSRMDVFYWKTIQHLLLKSMDRIIAISKSTKLDILHFYNLSSERVCVIYPALDHLFRNRQVGVEQLLMVLQKYDIRQPYILSVGGLAMHKNIYTTLQAFYSLIDQGYIKNHEFVIVGDCIHTHNDQRLFDLAAQRNRKRVRFTGVVDDDDLPYIYAGASLFVYPSLYEGFGLAPLEAMACGVPVLATQKSSVPEVVGDAAWLVEDPLDISEFAQAMVTLLLDSATLAKMRACGLNRSQTFTWKKTAEHTLALYREVIEEHGR